MNLSAAILELHELNERIRAKLNALAQEGPGGEGQGTGCGRPGAVGAGSAQRPRPAIGA